jgi:hypothetical protein
MSEREMEREGRKPNTVGAHNAPAALLSAAKSGTGDRSGC